MNILQKYCILQEKPFIFILFYNKFDIIYCIVCIITLYISYSSLNCTYNSVFLIYMHWRPVTAFDQQKPSCTEYTQMY